MDAATGVLLARAHEAWPADWVPDEIFVARLAGANPACVQDLYLACACALGVAAALAELSRLHLEPIGIHLDAFGRGQTFVDEVRQRLAVMLLVTEPDRAPRIATYRGEAPLSAWLRSAAIRTALNLCRQSAAEPGPLDDDATANGQPPDVELHYLRERYGAVFRDALAAALEALDDRERALLRLRIIDRLELDEIAALHGVHRNTVTRWLRACRVRLRGTMRQRVKKSGLVTTDLDGIGRLLSPDLNGDIARLLGA